MKVKELIEQLKKCNQDAEVLIPDNYEDSYSYHTILGEIEEVDPSQGYAFWDLV